MKEKIKGIEKAFAKKGKILDPYKQIYELSQEQFDLQSEINKVGNKIWKLKNEKTALCQKKAKLEVDKQVIFQKLGREYVEVEQGDKK